MDTLKNTEKRIQSLSGFQPVCYDCCPSSCVCYTGPYETLLKCPKCDTNQYKADGTTPQAYFLYLPIIPWHHPMVSMPLLRERCSTELVTDMIEQKWQISLMVLIIPYFGSHLSLLVARSFWIGSSLTLAILHLVCPLMALVLSSSVPKLHGQLSYSTTISLLKSDFWRRIIFQLALFLDQRSLVI